MTIVILGAGPAGSSCAISLLKTGHEVTIIDRSNFPRHTPGETLHPGIEPLLNQLGVSHILKNNSYLRHKGVESIRNGQSEFSAYHESEDWQGFQLYRADFDHQLLNEAIRLGARFIPDSSVSTLNYNNEFVESIKVNDELIEIDFAIDATGKRAWLANKLGINYKRIGSQKIAYYGYVESASLNPTNPMIEWDENGWTWIAQGKEDITTWVRLDIDNLSIIDNDWIPYKLSDGKPNGKRKAVDVTWRIAEQCSLANYFLIGDAAFVLDPGSSHGVLKAIMSGMMVAHLIQKTKDHPVDEIHQYYNSWIKDQFYHDIEKLKEMYSKYKFKTNANNVYSA